MYGLLTNNDFSIVSFISVLRPDEDNGIALRFIMRGATTLRLDAFLLQGPSKIHFFYTFIGRTNGE